MDTKEIPLAAYSPTLKDPLLRANSPEEFEQFMADHPELSISRATLSDNCATEREVFTLQDENGCECAAVVLEMWAKTRDFLKWAASPLRNSVPSFACYRCTNTPEPDNVLPEDAPVAEVESPVLLVAHYASGHTMQADLWKLIDKLNENPCLMEHLLGFRGEIFSVAAPSEDGDFTPTDVRSFNVDLWAPDAPEDVEHGSED